MVIVLKKTIRVVVAQSKKRRNSDVSLNKDELVVVSEPLCFGRGALFFYNHFRRSLCSLPRHLSVSSARPPAGGLAVFLHGENYSFPRPPFG